jgi:hypothetical protein
MPLSAQIVEHLGRHVLFHLHSTGYRHYRHVLDIPGIAGLQVVVEANGPRLADMVPALREILERSRLILMVDGHMDQLPEALRRLPREGLYLILSDKFVQDGKEFGLLLGEVGMRSARVVIGGGQDYELAEKGGGVVS